MRRAMRTSSRKLAWALALVAVALLPAAANDGLDDLPGQASLEWP